MWFFDVDVDGSSGPSVPVVYTEIKSGVIRFFRSSWINSDTVFPLGEDAGLAFSGSSTFNSTAPQASVAAYTQGLFGVQILASHANLGASTTSLITNLLVDQDTVIDNLWNQPIGPNQYANFGNVCVNETAASPVLYASGGTVQFKNYLYGINNSGVVLKLGSYSKATYTDKTKLVVALVAVASTGVIDYTNLVLKDFTAANLPFVSNATASDSQAGFIADV